MKLQFKLYLLFALLIAAPLVAMATMGERTASRDRERQAYERLEVASVVARNLVAERQGALLARMRSARPAMRAPLDGAAVRALRRHLGAAYLAYVDDRGRTIEDGERPAGPRVEQSLPLTGAVDGHLVAADPVPAEVLGDAARLVGLPAEMLFVDADGTTPALAGAVVPPGRGAIDSEGRRLLTASMPVPGGAVAAVADRDRILDKGGALGTRLAWVAVGGISLMLLLGWLLARWVTSPVRELAAVAGRLSRRDFTARAKVRSGDEVGALAQTLNASAEEIEGYVETLRRERTRSTDALAATVRLLGAADDPEQLATAVLDAACAGVDGGRGLVWIRMPDSAIPIAVGPLLNDASAASLAATAIDPDAQGPATDVIAGPRMLAVAMRRAPDQPPVGALVVAAREGGEFSPSDVTIAKSIAASAAVAVERIIEAEIERQRSITDPLTGVRSRRYLDVHPEEHRGAGLLVLDVDFFKRINDGFGHQEGDRVLTAFGALLQSVVREHDTVIRLGGDEFCLVLPDTSAEGCEIVAAKVVKAVRESIVLPDGQSVTTTIGWAVSDPDDPDPDFESLYQAADQALYVAKRRGRDGFAGPADVAAIAAA